MSKALLIAGMLLAGAMVPPTARAEDVALDTTPVTVRQKWDFFKEETFSTYTLLSSGVTASVSQAVRSDPQYGVGAVALSERLGATIGDNISQNFFSDFVMASVLHQDTRYRRKGEEHGFWSRLGYAVSRAFVTRTDTGGRAFNWSNLTGCALQAGLSNAYYPSASRSGSATAINWANSVSASGFGNLFPEFLPDFKRWLKRHHL